MYLNVWADYLSRFLRKISQGLPKLILAKYQEKYLKIENEMLKADNNDIRDFSFFSF